MYVPSVNNWEHTSVPKLTTLARHGHVAEGGATEVEVGAANGPVASVGALVRHNYGHSASGAYALVLALHLKARPTTCPVPVQRRAHCSNPGPHRLHVH